MKIFSRIVSAIFPDRCCVCGDVVSPGVELCDDCLKYRLRFCVGEKYCTRCGRPFNECTCDSVHVFKHAVFPFFYEDRVRMGIDNFKFGGRLYRARLFALQMYKSAKGSGILGNADCVVYVPMHPVKKIIRGYNQTTVLAKEFSKLSGLPVIKALKKNRFTTAQHNLDAAERRKNIKGTFSFKTKKRRKIEGKNIILIDDIMTTRSTMNECSLTLLNNGAANVDALAIAAVRLHRER